MPPTTSARRPRTDAERRLVWRALSLAERLVVARDATGGGRRDAVADADAGVAAWAAALGSEEALHRRIEWAMDGAAEARHLAQVAMAPEPPGESTLDASWLPTLRALSEAMRDGGTDEPPGSATALPFVHLWLPALHVAREALGTAAPPPRHRVLREALEAALLRRLTTLGAQPLYREFGIGRPAGSRLDALSATPPRDRYLAFVAAHRADGGARLFDRYPVLARLAAVTIDRWVAFTARIERCLQDDDAALGAHFGHGDTAGTITTADVGLSDPHAGHATVCRLRFDSGIDVAWKPRDVALEATLERALARLAAHGLDAPEAAPTLARDGHGYVAWVAHRPCTTPAEQARFYHRAGILLALLHALRGTDVHHENLVASGDRPVLVDAETLMQPELVLVDAGDDAPPLAYSVLRTGMLPVWQPDASGAAHDISALGAVEPIPVPPGLAWRAVNTDAMHPVQERPAATPATNAPSLHDATPDPATHADAVDAGFSAAAAVLRATREAWAAGSALEPPRSARARVVLRATRVYGALLHASLTADALRDGARRSLALEPMLRAFLQGTEPPAHWPLALAEQAEIFDLDVPCFSAGVHTRVVIAASGASATVLTRSPLDAAREGLAALDDADVALQRALLRGALLAPRARSLRAPAVARAQAIGRGDRAAPEPPFDPLQVAQRIATDLAALAHDDGRGGLLWLGPRFDATHDTFTFHEVGESLYEGRLGIALFLAACDAAAGRTDHAAHVRGALFAIERYLAVAGGAPSEWFVRRLGIGGAFGVGSLVRGFTMLAKVTGDSHFLEQAARAAHLITPARIAGDATLDVTGGSAGALLALLDLHEATGEGDVLDRATRCADHLAATARDLGGGASGWHTIAAHPLAGAAHGLAGIACALARYDHVAGTTACAPLVRGALRAEAALRDSATGGWFDRREGSAPGAVSASWCAGSAGIALARIAIDGLSPGGDAYAGVAADIDGALVHASQAPDTGLDTLCCGEGGRIEALVTGSALPGRMALGEEVHARARAMAARAFHEGHFRCLPGMDAQLVHPGLYQGIGGIGWTMLRVAGAVTMSPLQFTGPGAWRTRQAGASFTPPHPNRSDTP